MAPARGLFAGVRRRLTNLPWWLPLVLAPLLLLDACSRPNSWRSHSAAGVWLRGQARELGPHPTRPLDHAIIRGPDGAERIEHSWDRGLVRPEGETVVAEIVLFGPVRERSGLWAMTREKTWLSTDNVPTEWSADRRREVGQMIDDKLAREGVTADWGPRRAARMFRDGTYTITKALPGGYIHNTLAITLALAFLWSCTLGRPWRDWAAMRRAHYLWQGRCPRCRYPTRGYDGTICPECGHDHADPADPDAG